MKKKLNPKNFDISLVFFKNNNKYPQKGSIVRFDHKDFCDHIEDVELGRSESDVLKNGETFCYITQGYIEMYYGNSFNKLYPYLRDDIPMIVEEIYFDGKIPMARCSVNGYTYPSDSVEDMKVHVKADDLSVVDIVLCDYVGVYSDKIPSDKYMSIYDKFASESSGVDVLQTFAIREGYKYSDSLKQQVIDSGLKEFSYIYPIDPVSKKPVSLIREKDIIDPLDKFEDIESSIDSLRMNHPLSNYTMRMFASVMENININDLDELEISDMYFDMLSVMKNTMIDSKNNVIMTEDDIEISNNVDKEY